jgi:hypothetical protein
LSQYKKERKSQCLPNQLHAGRITRSAQNPGRIQSRRGNHVDAIKTRCFIAGGPTAPSQSVLGVS